MKKLWIGLVAALMLSGCGAKQTMETVADDIPAQPVLAPPAEISVHLPDNAVAPVLSSDSEQVYLCDDYEIAIETHASGDLTATITAISGYDPDRLTVVHTRQDGAERYDFVWVSAGETGERLGRAVVLDDGQYHYSMSVLRDAEDTKKSQVVWSEVFGSFCLA